MHNERLILPEEVNPEDLDGQDVLVLRGDDAHHLTRVVRLREGAQLFVGDGRGGLRLATVISVEPDQMKLSWIEGRVVAPEPCPRVSLVLAGLQGKDLNAAVVGAVEAGADALWLTTAERSQRPLPEEGSSTWLRLTRLIRAAAAQAGQARIPALYRASTLEEAIPNLDLCWFAHGTGSVEVGSSFMGASLTDIGILVGPEGGWSPDEIRWMSEQGIPSLWLGPCTLRARTAAELAVHRLVWERARSASIGPVTGEVPS